MNKPYIWMDDLGTWFTDEDYQELDESLKDGLIPLYTHPVTEHFEDEPQAEELHEIMQSNAELTDEEIEELIWNTTDMKDFARAILRKAQEK